MKQVQFSVDRDSECQDTFDKFVRSAASCRGETADKEKVERK